MKMGMARLVQYEGVEQTPELKQDQKNGRLGSLMTTLVFGKVKLEFILIDLIWD